MSFETDLREAMREHATPITASAELRAVSYRPRSERVRPRGVAVAVVLVACVTAIAIGVASPWNGGTSLAQAFPVLSGPTTLTPASLSQALKVYGVGANNDGLDRQHAHPVRTPWGEAYVLTNASKEAVCVAAPAPDSIAWVASCNQTNIAQTYGTALVSFAYDRTNNSVRVVALLPAGASVLLITGGQRTTVPIHQNLLALTAKPGSEVRVSVHGRSFADKVTTGATAPDLSRGGSSPAQASGSSTAAASVGVG